MDKNTETLMTWALTIGVPLMMLQIQEIIGSRKHRRDIAEKQLRRDEAISHDVASLKSTTDKIAAVLDRVDDRLDTLSERVARVETKIN
ncbi:MAG: hypothetical protein V7K98_23950 [Nostoc sp.]|uniref:hypothetical protein n=1 Tax=Nostoc sp. TaxID=1180 RepID=UPI002FFBDD09